MKVWEYMNKLKGTNATLEQIKTWSYMNKEAPCDFREPMNGLEIDGGIPESFERFIGQWCALINDCDRCYKEFFELEIPEMERKV